MYPNTIEVNQNVQPRFTLTFNLPKLFIILGLIVSLLIIVASQLNAKDYAVVQSLGFKNTNTTAYFEFSLMSDDSMDRLRSSLQRNLVDDGFILKEKKRVNIIFNDNTIYINDQELSLELFHKYSAILYAYGIESAPDRKIILKNKWMMIGRIINGKFSVQNIYGTFGFEL